MERRLILQLVSAGFLVPASNAQPEDYKPLFFTPEQMDALDRLTEILIPADDHSPGASDALVNRYLDVIVAGSSETAQRIWRQGMEAVEAEAKSRFQHGLAACSPEQREQIVATMAANELNPSTELERFFRTLKRMTIDGYYTSKIGIHEELEYQGNTVVANFEGCTHPEHQA